MPFPRSVSVILLAALAAPLAAQEDDPFAPQEAADESPGGRSAGLIAGREVKPDDAPTAAELLRRADEALRSAAEVQAALGETPAAAAKPDAPVRLVPDDLHLGKVYLGAKHVRYLAMQVWLVNTAGEPVTVPRESFRLRTRGDELAAGQVPERQGLRHLPAGPRFVPIEELSKTGPVTVPANGVVGVPVAFFDLPGTSEVPEMTLRLPVGGAAAEIDLNDYALGLMRLQVERLGPGGLLGLVTVAGEVTPVGAGELARVLQKLSDAKATRVVLAWDGAAPPVPPDLANWLVQSATRIDGGLLNDGQHPLLPPALAELHLASIPDGTGVPNYPGPRRVHPSVGEAVAAAVGGAFDAVPLDALLREIESGHPLTRPAAIAAGGRLPDDRLVLRLTDDEDPAIATAAVRALRDFGSEAAIGRLVDLARSGREPIRSAAVASLAASRYGAAHEALRELLDASANGRPVIPPAALVPVLAEHPRPLWGDALHRMATQGDPAVRAEALDALARLGHPQLIAAFEAALGDADGRLRKRAFALVARRQDPASEELALAFTLNHLESAPPTREMSALLERTKDPRAVPLLLKHLDAGGPQRAEAVRLVAQLGGLEVRDALEAVYPKLDRAAQPQALASLARMRSPKFYEFAGAALRSNDPALVNAAAQQLQADGGPEAARLLAEILFESDQPAILSYAANGLAGIGTPEARVALRKAVRAPGPRRDAAGQAWWNLQRQSAGWEPFVAAEAAKKREDWQQAVERYTDALGVDPQFVDAWSGRAGAHMQLGDYAAARADYEKALEFDPNDTAAVTCLGILKVFEGRVDEGLTFVRDRAAEFADSDLYAYNTACLYAVASERVESSDPARAERLRSDAVKELARAIELGMTTPDEVAWMRKDPDLKSLRGRPDFEKVVAAIEAKIGKGR